MTNIENGPAGPQKEQVENEFQVLNEKGEPVEKMHLPDDIGDEFYVEVLSDSEQKILPYKKLVKIEGTERGWGEEVAPGKIQQIEEQNIKVGKVDRANKTISFFEKPSEATEEFSEKLIREEDLQHVIPLLESHYRISKPTEENITPQILRHVADKIELDIHNEKIAEKLRKEILNLSY